MNSIIALRKQQLLLSERRFNTRGKNLKRCSECLLAEKYCICDQIQVISSDFAVCFLMYHGEYFKPSNTGQLVSAVVAHNFAFRWQRTELEPELKELLADPQWQGIVIFPHDDVDTERQVFDVTSFDGIQNKTLKPLFIFLDGTWRQAKKIFKRSPYLAELPVLAIEHKKSGDYQLRASRHDHHLGTAEVAIEVFKQVGEHESAQALSALNTAFIKGYLDNISKT
jgi:DTW domain-containing protein